MRVGRRSKLAAAFVAVALLGGVAGRYVRISYGPSPPEPPALAIALHRADRDQYRYIHPLIGFDVADKRGYEELRPITDRISSLLEKRVHDGQLLGAGVYVRMVDTGHWTGVNEGVEFIPASMLKVPLLMTYFRIAESNPAIFDRVLSFHGEFDLNTAQRYFNDKPLSTWNSYTVDDLLTRMIVNSDNNATVILTEAIGRDELTETLRDISVPLTSRSFADDAEPQFEVSPKAYSVVFRTLYDATYLGRAASERALALLTRTDFTKGLVAGIPTGTAIAHKYGERSVVGAEGQVLTRELHEAGIVYAAGNPYFVCVMTRGVEYAPLLQFIADVSRIAYDGIARSRKP